MVEWDKDGELLYMATWLPLCVQLYPIRKRKIENVITDEIGVSDIFPKFIASYLLQNCHLL